MRWRIRRCLFWLDEHPDVTLFAVPLLLITALLGSYWVLSFWLP